MARPAVAAGADRRYRAGVMDLLATLGLALGASWTSGLRLYAVVAVLGLLGRYGGLALPGDLGVLTTPWVIGLALALYAVEFVADKVPYVDTAWDAVHTFVRIPAGAVLAAGAFGDYDPAVKVGALLVGGGLALASHGAKAAARALVNTSPEPVSNVVASTAEDGLALGTLAAAAFAPVVAIGLVVAGVAVALWVLPKALRAGRRLFGRPAPTTGSQTDERR